MVGVKNQIILKKFVDAFGLDVLVVGLKLIFEMT